MTALHVFLNLPKSQRERIVKVARAVLSLTVDPTAVETVFDTVTQATAANHRRTLESAHYWREKRRAQSTDETSHYRSA